MPLCQARLLTLSIFRNSAPTIDSGGTMKVGIFSNPGPHSQPARKTTNRMRLAMVPRRTTEERVLIGPLQTKQVHRQTAARSGDGPSAARYSRPPWGADVGPADWRDPGCRS